MAVDGEGRGGEARAHGAEPLLAFLGIAVLVIVDAGAGHGPDDPEHARGRAARRHRDGDRGGSGPGCLDGCRQRGLAALLVASARRSRRSGSPARPTSCGWARTPCGLRSASRGESGRGGGTPSRSRRLAPSAAFRQGVLSNLGNPKMAVFFTSLLPQFAPAGACRSRRFSRSAFMFCAMTLFWLAAYAARWRGWATSCAGPASGGSSRP